VRTQFRLGVFQDLNDPIEESCGGSAGEDATVEIQRQNKRRADHDLLVTYNRPFSNEPERDLQGPGLGTDDAIDAIFRR